MGELLSEHLPEWSFRHPDGGLSLWVKIPGATGEDFATVALQHGVAVLPGNAASPRDEQPDRIRISFAESDDRIVEGVERLRAAWTAYEHSTVGAPLPAPTLG